MKNFHFNLGRLIFLVLGITLGSCNVYHSAPGTVNEAVESENRVRLVTKDNKAFELKNLRKEGEELVGTTGKNSETAKMLNGREKNRVGKNVEIVFQRDEIMAVYLKNKKMSRWVNYGVPVIGTAGIIGVTSSNFKPDVGF
ncbi:hypothetical protein [Salinimicrobium sediminilitoris]|uniref:hypothetical protein n=1 Tax=Salinimicrobium sediminilitoris TaxID=2876715 RepID=UPI001E31D776|nr:hypothetical protein [Salinimicrobium sediminilitoris]MCC8360326.1 hypothetical protein [Salinimicrobium sediminilitoris]